ncbi:MAG: hypothetical protein AB1401_00585 [Thermodesulfobacteriota bacterium]
MRSIEEIVESVLMEEKKLFPQESDTERLKATKHLCKRCESPVINGRIICPRLEREIALEGCNRIYGGNCAPVL